MANSYIRDLSSMAGDQTSFGGQIQNTDSYSKFGLALMQLLKQQQSLGTQQFVQAEQRGVQEQAGRIMAQTPQELIGAHPSLQSQVRSAQASAMEPTIQGAAKLGKTFSEQIAGLGDAISQARAIGSMMQQEEESKRQQAIDMIYKFPTAVKTLDDKTKKTLAQQAGIPIDFINALPEEEQEKWTQITLSDGSLAQQNTKTGEIKVLVKADIAGDGAGVASSYSIETNQRVLDSVKDLINRVSPWTVGGGGGLLSKIPGTSATNFSADLETLKANIAFGSLVAMREASKTGGALGQVSDREGQLLQSTLGALNTSQSPENFKKNLERIRDSIQKWMDAVYEAEYNNLY